jgi:hypothetical protein
MNINHACDAIGTHIKSFKYDVLYVVFWCAFARTRTRWVDTFSGTNVDPAIAFLLEDGKTAINSLWSTKRIESFFISITVT